MYGITTNEKGVHAFERTRSGVYGNLEKGKKQEERGGGGRGEGERERIKSPGVVAHTFHPSTWLGRGRCFSEFFHGILAVQEGISFVFEVKHYLLFPSCAGQHRKGSERHCNGNLSLCFMFDPQFPLILGFSLFGVSIGKCP